MQIAPAVATYKNPVWERYMADPFVIRVGQKYYAYGTSDERANGKVFPILESEDLANWTYVDNALVALADPSKSCYWAPAVAERDGKFYLYYSAGGPAGEGHQLRVAMSKSPTGPFIDQDKVLLPEESFTIDAEPFRDPQSGKWYLFFSKDFYDGRAGTGIAVVGLNDDMVSVSGPIHTVVRATEDWQIFERNRDWLGKKWDKWHTVEGASVIYKNGKYYCLYSGGRWESDGYGVGYAVSDTVTGPYVDSHNQSGASVLSAHSGKLLGPGHNSLTVAPDGKTDVIIYHAWDPKWTARRMCVDVLKWTEEGPHCDGPSSESSEIPQ